MKKAEKKSVSKKEPMRVAFLLGHGYVAIGSGKLFDNVGIITFQNCVKQNKMGAKVEDKDLDMNSPKATLLLNLKGVNALEKYVSRVKNLLLEKPKKTSKAKKTKK